MTDDNDDDDVLYTEVDYITTFKANYSINFTKYKNRIIRINLKYVQSLTCSSNYTCYTYTYLSHKVATQ